MCAHGHPCDRLADFVNSKVWVPIIGMRSGREDAARGAAQLEQESEAGEAGAKAQVPPEQQPPPPQQRRQHRQGIGSAHMREIAPELCRALASSPSSVRSADGVGGGGGGGTSSGGVGAPFGRVELAAAAAASYASAIHEALRLGDGDTAAVAALGFHEVHTRRLWVRRRQLRPADRLYTATGEGAQEEEEEVVEEEEEEEAQQPRMPGANIVHLGRALMVSAGAHAMVGRAALTRGLAHREEAAAAAGHVGGGGGGGTRGGSGSHHAEGEQLAAGGTQRSDLRRMVESGEQELRLAERHTQAALRLEPSQHLAALNVGEQPNHGGRACSPVHAVAWVYSETDRWTGRWWLTWGLLRTGLLAENTGRLVEAAAAYSRAVELAGTITPSTDLPAAAAAATTSPPPRQPIVRPDVAAVVSASNNLGNVLQMMGRWSEGLAAYESALTLQPGHAEAWNNRGVALLAGGRLLEARTSYGTALRLRGGLDGGFVQALGGLLYVKASLCDWRDSITELSLLTHATKQHLMGRGAAALLPVQALCQPLPLHLPRAVVELHALGARRAEEHRRRYARKQRERTQDGSRTSTTSTMPPPPDVPAGRKRLCYVSARVLGVGDTNSDSRDSSSDDAIRGVQHMLALHNRSLVEVVLFSLAPGDADRDPETAPKLAMRGVEVGADYLVHLHGAVEPASDIRRWHCAVAIHLDGHASYARPELFLRSLLPDDFHSAVSGTLDRRGRCEPDNGGGEERDKVVNDGEERQGKESIERRSLLYTGGATLFAAAAASSSAELAAAAAAAATWQTRLGETWSTQRSGCGHCHKQTSGASSSCAGTSANSGGKDATSLGLASLQVAVINQPYIGTMGNRMDFDFVVGDRVGSPLELQATQLSEQLLEMPYSGYFPAGEGHTTPNASQRSILWPPHVIGQMSTAGANAQDSTSFRFVNLDLGNVHSCDLDHRVLTVWANLLRRCPGAHLWSANGRGAARRATARGSKDRRARVRHIAGEWRSRGLGSKHLRWWPLKSADSEARDQRQGRDVGASSVLGLDTRQCSAQTGALKFLAAARPYLTTAGGSLSSRAAASLAVAHGLPDLLTHSEKEYEDMAVALASRRRDLQSAGDSARLAKPGRWKPGSPAQLAWLTERAALGRSSPRHGTLLDRAKWVRSFEARLAEAGDWAAVDVERKN
jgi:tetratricopeptide (TPR) repeat protein